VTGSRYVPGHYVPTYIPAHYVKGYNTTTGATTNTPPNYCNVYYTCSASVWSALSYSGFGLYAGNGFTSYDPALTSQGQSDGWTYIASWTDYHNFGNGAPVYAYYNGVLNYAPGCNDADVDSAMDSDNGICAYPMGIPYFTSGGYTLLQGESLNGYPGTYQPECASSNASNNYSYLSSCVYPYDSSYASTTGGTVTHVPGHEVAGHYSSHLTTWVSGYNYSYKHTEQVKVTTVVSYAATGTSKRLVGVQPIIQDTTSGTYYHQQWYGNFCSGGTIPLISPSSSTFPDYSGALWEYTNFFEGQKICTFNPTSIPGNNVQSWQIAGNTARMELIPKYSITANYNKITTVNGKVTSSVPKTYTETVNGTAFYGPQWPLYSISSSTCSVQSGLTYCPGQPAINTQM
jgi:hypothetical protein